MFKYKNAASRLLTDWWVLLDARLSETTRLTHPGQRSTLDEHLPPEHIVYKMRGPSWCIKLADTVGPHCRTMIEQLFANNVLDRLRSAQGVISLAKHYGAVRLEAACRRALAFENLGYRSVKTILDKGLDQVADPEMRLTPSVMPTPVEPVLDAIPEIFLNRIDLGDDVTDIAQCRSIATAPLIVLRRKSPNEQHNYHSPHDSRNPTAGTCSNAQAAAVVGDHRNA